MNFKEQLKALRVYGKPLLILQSDWDKEHAETTEPKHLINNYKHTDPVIAARQYFTKRFTLKSNGVSLIAVWRLE